MDDRLCFSFKMYFDTVYFLSYHFHFLNSSFPYPLQKSQTNNKQKMKIKINKKLVRPKNNNKMKQKYHKRQTQSPFCIGQLLLDLLCTKVNRISFRMLASVLLRYTGLSFGCFTFIAVVFLPGLGSIIILTSQNKFRSISPISTLLNNLRIIGCGSLKVWQSSVVNPSGSGCFLVKGLSLTV